MLETEAPNKNSAGFSDMSIAKAVELMNSEDLQAVKAVQAAKSQIVEVITQSTRALQEGGRIIYVGAGTSGRLGVLDAVECPPTFGVDENIVIGVIAGGENAFVSPREGAEDSPQLGKEALQAKNLSSQDMVIGIAASGRTPFVLGALAYAEAKRCKTAAIVCTSDSEIAKGCPLTIELLPGPEVLTGSTRLKAGTATKMVLNMISTISMIGVGKVYKNYMVDVKMTNKKLQARGVSIVETLTGVSQEEAKIALDASSQEVKTAIVMLLAHVDPKEARELLAMAHGHIDSALAQHKQA